MRKFTQILMLTLTILIVQAATQAQVTGSITGTVLDQVGAVVPGATVTVKGESGQNFKATTSDDGVYNIPGIASGVYTVTFSSPNFKTAVVQNVKVDVGTPATVNTALTAGRIEETVVVTSGGEVLQTATATVGTTITGRQIQEAPIASRDALDLISSMPGTNTVGRQRTSTINGLPKSSLTITIDGVDVQTNDTRTSDGFFTYVRPRVDAIEEVSVSTASPGAESSGDGAVQIKFVTKRGTNDYTGGVFFEHRNEALNANYWFLNRNPAGLDSDGKAMRQKIRLFQYGAHASGPIPFLKFGEGTDGWLDKGKDKRFFFVNYEEFRLPQALSRTRKVLTPAAQAGIYKYRVATTGFATLPNTPTTTCVPFGTGQMECSVNVLAVAAANNQLATQDPFVAGLFNRIRTSLTGQTLVDIPSNPNLLDWNMTATNADLRKFLTMRFDFNVTKNHSAEFVMNRQEFGGSPDVLNGREPIFPGFPGYSQVSNRNSWTVALRSTLTKTLVNEARYAVQEGGPSLFFGELSAADFDYLGGRNITSSLTLGGTASSSPVNTTNIQNGKNPVFDLTDSMTWIKGNHSFNFGGQFKRVVAIGNNVDRVVPTIGFGLDSTTGSADATAYNMFSTCSGTSFTAACRLPGGGSTQQGELRSFYATLVGRVLSYTNTAYLDTTTGIYKEFIPRHRESEQKSYGLFVQDNWRLRPNLSINYGVRWQPQTGFVAKTYGNYTRLENPDQVWGTSGVGNLFKPGATGGSAPRVVPIQIGESSYPTDWNNFAPSVGVVWSPKFESGIMKALLGKPGQSVFRGGYSVSFVREGTSVLESINGANPGGTRVLSRTIADGTITAGTNYRDANNPNLQPLPGILGTTISFPIALNTTNSTNTFDPNIKTGQVASYTFGYQREIDRNTVVEVRYVGNRGTDLQRQINLNEFNTIENGFTTEFLLAQDNLYKNIAAGRGATFAYFGGTTGTNPLPIMLSYFNDAANYAPNDPTKYAGTFAANYSNSTLVTALSKNRPNIFAFNGTTFENSNARRANAVANGRPANFFYVNPTSAASGSWTVVNTQQTWYDSAVIEVRRRLSAGLRLSANYVFAKAQSNAFTTDAPGGGALPTLRPDGYELAKGVQISDIRHAFKLDATYDFPFGRGRAFLSNTNWFVDTILGGWTISPTLRWQSGPPIQIGHVQLVGMTQKELQKAVKVRKEASLVFWLPDDIILNSQKAFDINVANTTTNNGFGTTFGTGGPTGRFIAPATYGNCIESYTGQCGFNNLVIYGPGFFKLDASLGKKFGLGEKRSIEFRMLALDVLNHANFRVGGWAGDTAGSGCCTATFGQLGNGTAYQDTSTTNDPGGRILDFMVRVNW